MTAMHYFQESGSEGGFDVEEAAQAENVYPEFRTCSERGRRRLRRAVLAGCLSFVCLDNPLW